MPRWERRIRKKHPEIARTVRLRSWTLAYEHLRAPRHNDGSMFCTERSEDRYELTAVERQAARIGQRRLRRVAQLLGEAESRQLRGGNTTPWTKDPEVNATWLPTIEINPAPEPAGPCPAEDATEDEAASSEEEYTYAEPAVGTDPGLRPSPHVGEVAMQAAGEEAGDAEGTEPDDTVIFDDGG